MLLEDFDKAVRQLNRGKNKWLSIFPIKRVKRATLLPCFERTSKRDFLENVSKECTRSRYDCGNNGKAPDTEWDLLGLHSLVLQNFLNRDYTKEHSPISAYASGRLPEKRTHGSSLPNGSASGEPGFFLPGYPLLSGHTPVTP
jgi:hypothetical protein